MNQILENEFIEKLTRGFQVSPLQFNRQQESDAEIIQILGVPGRYFAITTDSLVEEVELGLYHDPFLIGWMAVMASLSDLAAVGAEPLGLVVSEILPNGYSPKDLAGLQAGINEAVGACGTYVLGGDTNVGSHLTITGTALGIIDGEPLTRRGVQPDDLLYVSGAMGGGNAYALSRLQEGSGSVPYRPVARLRQGQLARSFASACMDTSDGLLATVDQLMRVNNVGFALADHWSVALDMHALDIARGARIPEWLFLAGHHGEYELAFTIPPALEIPFLESAERIGWKPMWIGNATNECAITIPLNQKRLNVDTGWIRNLSMSVRGDIKQYITSLLQFDETLRKGVLQHV